MKPEQANKIDAKAPLIPKGTDGTQRQRSKSINRGAH